MLMLATALPAFAASPASNTPFMKAMALLGMGVCMGAGAIGPGIGIGISGAGAMEGMARNPEMERKLRTTMFISMAFCEACALYAMVITFILYGRA